jgi:hypothetical protein
MNRIERALNTETPKREIASKRDSRHFLGELRNRPKEDGEIRTKFSNTVTVLIMLKAM